jgi:hypothetical protein
MGGAVGSGKAAFVAPATHGRAGCEKTDVSAAKQIQGEKRVDKEREAERQVSTADPCISNLQQIVTWFYNTVAR